MSVRVMEQTPRGEDGRNFRAPRSVSEGARVTEAVAVGILQIAEVLPRSVILSSVDVAAYTAAVRALDRADAETKVNIAIGARSMNAVTDVVNTSLYSSTWIPDRKALLEVATNRVFGAIAFDKMRAKLQAEGKDEREVGIALKVASGALSRSNESLLDQATVSIENQLESAFSNHQITEAFVDNAGVDTRARQLVETMVQRLIPVVEAQLDKAHLLHVSSKDGLQTARNRALKYVRVHQGEITSELRNQDAVGTQRDDATVLTYLKFHDAPLYRQYIAGDEAQKGAILHNTRTELQGDITGVNIRSKIAKVSSEKVRTQETLSETANPKAEIIAKEWDPDVTSNLDIKGAASTYMHLVQQGELSTAEQDAFNAARGQIGKLGPTFEAMVDTYASLASQPANYLTLEEQRKKNKLQREIGSTVDALVVRLEAKTRADDPSYTALSRLDSVIGGMAADIIEARKPVGERVVEGLSKNADIFVEGLQKNFDLRTAEGWANTARVGFAGIIVGLGVAPAAKAFFADQPQPQVPDSFHPQDSQTFITQAGLQPLLDHSGTILAPYQDTALLDRISVKTALTVSLPSLILAACDQAGSQPPAPNLPPTLSFPAPDDDTRVPRKTPTPEPSPTAPADYIGLGRYINAAGIDTDTSLRTLYTTQVPIQNADNYQIYNTDEGGNTHIFNAVIRASDHTVSILNAVPNADDVGVKDPAQLVLQEQNLAEKGWTFVYTKNDGSGGFLVVQVLFPSYARGEDGQIIKGSDGQPVVAHAVLAAEKGTNIQKVLMVDVNGNILQTMDLPVANVGSDEVVYFSAIRGEYVRAKYLMDKDGKPLIVDGKLQVDATTINPVVGFYKVADAVVTPVPGATETAAADAFQAEQTVEAQQTVKAKKTVEATPVPPTPEPTNEPTLQPTDVPTVEATPTWTTEQIFQKQLENVIKPLNIEAINSDGNNELDPNVVVVLQDKENNNAMVVVAGGDYKLPAHIVGYFKKAAQLINEWDRQTGGSTMNHLSKDLGVVAIYKAKLNPTNPGGPNFLLSSSSPDAYNYDLRRTGAGAITINSDRPEWSAKYINAYEAGKGELYAVYGLIHETGRFEALRQDPEGDIAKVTKRVEKETFERWASVMDPVAKKVLGKLFGINQ